MTTIETMTAYCGLTCDSCPIHLATLEQDKSQQRAMRVSIAEECYTIYGMNLLPEDITDCDGCRANTGRIFSGCSDCGIRMCASGRNIDCCAFCKDYACERLQKHFDLDPYPQIKLEEIRRMNNPLRAND